MSDTKYYYADASKKPVGPYTLEELHALATRGVITPTTKVIAKGEKSWMAYSQMPKVPAAAAPTPPVAAPTPSPAPPESTAEEGGSFLTKLPKPLVFSLVGAIGCLVGGIGAELLLALFPEPSKEKPNVCLLIDTSLSMAQRGNSKVSVDIFFVVDVTGSMGSVIKGIKNGIGDFAAELADKNIDGRIGCLGFGDLTVGDEPYLLKFEGSPFTRNAGQFREAVATMRLLRGGDAPESSFDAVVLSAKQPFRKDAKKIIILITDALPQAKGESVGKDEVLGALGEYKIDHLHLVVSESHRARYAELQSVTSGEFFPLQSTAAGREGFDKVLPEIGKTIAEKAGRTLDPATIDPLSKIVEVQHASVGFVVRQQTNAMNIAVVRFGDDAKIVQALTHENSVITNAIGRLVPAGETALDLGLKMAIGQLDPSKRKSLATTDTDTKQNFVILFTDGKPNNEEAALLAAQELRRTGVQIYAIHTADAPGDFLEKLTGSADQVISTSSRSIDDAFKFVEEKIAFGLTGESGGGMSSQLLRDSIRFAFIAMVLALALTIAQNVLTAGSGAIRLLSTQQMIIALAIGGAAGFLAGGTSLLFQLISINQTVVFAGRIIAWGLLAAVIGWAMIFVIANFNALRATSGGLLGGLIGGSIFSLINAFSSGGSFVVLGNLLGATVVGAMIGLIIAWVEHLTRKAWLTVFWTPNQHSNINLGAKPVTIGGGSDDIRIKGLGENALSIVLSDGRILCTQQPGNKEAELKDQSVLSLGKTRLVVHAQKEG